MTIAQCITFLIDKLVQLLTSQILFPFVGIWAAAYIIYLVIQMVKFKGRRI